MTRSHRARRSRRAALALIAATAGAASTLAPSVPALAVNQRDVDAAQSVMATAQRKANAAKRRLDQIEEAEANAQGNLASLDKRLGELVDEENRLSASVRQRAVEAYKHGGNTQLMSYARSLEHPDTEARRSVYLTKLLDEDGAALKKLTAVRTDVAAERAKARSVKAQLAKLDDEATAAAKQAQNLLDDAAAQLKKLRNQKAVEDAAASGDSATVAVASAPVDGMVCPVAGPVSFSNDFGAARFGGGFHRHQGNDLLGSQGTPLVAIVSGRVYQVGSNGLGGNRLWLAGDNGIHYYYAHNSVNIAGEGAHVNAGTVIAKMGNTGDARGGPYHLHFEMHPGRGAAVNPYPVTSRICR